MLQSNPTQPGAGAGPGIPSSHADISHEDPRAIGLGSLTTFDEGLTWEAFGRLLVRPHHIWVRGTTRYWMGDPEFWR